MRRSFLIRLFGFSAALIHGDTLVMDRWRWLAQRLPKPLPGARALDVGCGNGVFSMALAQKGYPCLGISWKAPDITEAGERAKLCNIGLAKFETQDIRHLDQRKDFVGNFAVVICLEAIEHIIDDQKLVKDISGCLQPQGKLFLTTPNYGYAPIGIGDGREIIRPEVEDGSHVRVGYTAGQLQKLCRNANLKIEEISFCSGFLSQKITWLMRRLARAHLLLGWICVLPLRPLPLLLDDFISKVLKWPGYSICIVASKSTSGLK